MSGIRIAGAIFVRDDFHATTPLTMPDKIFLRQNKVFIRCNGLERIFVCDEVFDFVFCPELNWIGQCTEARKRFFCPEICDGGDVQSKSHRQYERRAITSDFCGEWV